MAQVTPINPLDFLKELIVRLGKKNPKFFNIINTILTIVAVITGIPLLTAALGLDLPDAWEAIQSKAVVIASAVGIFLSNLPMDKPEEVKATEPEKLPVTTKAENNEVAKAEIETAKIQNALGTK